MEKIKEKAKTEERRKMKNICRGGGGGQLRQKDGGRNTFWDTGKVYCCEGSPDVNNY
jgi:hypothetical protein